MADPLGGLQTVVSVLQNIAVGIGNLTKQLAATTGAIPISNVAGLGTGVAGALGNTAGASGSFDLFGKVAGISVARQAWTPSLLFGGASVGLTYSTQSGFYVQIDKLVVADFNIALSGSGSSTGVASISGLPVAAGPNSGQCLVNYYAGMSGMTAMINHVVSSGTSCVLEFIGAATFSAVTNSNFTNSSLLLGTCIYLVP